MTRHMTLKKGDGVYAQFYLVLRDGKIMYSSDSAEEIKRAFRAILRAYEEYEIDHTITYDLRGFPS
jgi:hypothetical protein